MALCRLVFSLENCSTVVQRTRRQCLSCCFSLALFYGVLLTSHVLLFLPLFTAGSESPAVLDPRARSSSFLPSPSTSFRSGGPTAEASQLPGAEAARRLADKDPSRRHAQYGGKTTSEKQRAQLPATVFQSPPARSDTSRSPDAFSAAHSHWKSAHISAGAPPPSAATAASTTRAKDIQAPRQPSQGIAPQGAQNPVWLQPRRWASVVRTTEHRSEMDVPSCLTSWPSLSSSSSYVKGARTPLLTSSNPLRHEAPNTGGVSKVLPQAGPRHSDPLVQAPGPGIVHSSLSSTVSPQSPNQESKKQALRHRLKSVKLVNFDSKRESSSGESESRRQRLTRSFASVAAGVRWPADGHGAAPAATSRTATPDVDTRAEAVKQMGQQNADEKKLDSSSPSEAAQHAVRGTQREQHLRERGRESVEAILQEQRARDSRFRLEQSAIAKAGSGGVSVPPDATRPVFTEVSRDASRTLGKPGIRQSLQRDSHAKESSTANTLPSRTTTGATARIKSSAGRPPPPADAAEDGGRNGRRLPFCAPDGGKHLREFNALRELFSPIWSPSHSPPPSSRASPLSSSFSSYSSSGCASPTPEGQNTEGPTQVPGKLDRVRPQRVEQTKDSSSSAGGEAGEGDGASRAAVGVASGNVTTPAVSPLELYETLLSLSAQLMAALQHAAAISSAASAAATGARSMDRAEGQTFNQQRHQPETTERPGELRHSSFVSEAAQKPIPAPCEKQISSECTANKQSSGVRPPPGFPAIAVQNRSPPRPPSGSVPPGFLAVAEGENSKQQEKDPGPDAPGLLKATADRKMRSQADSTFSKDPSPSASFPVEHHAPRSSPAGPVSDSGASTSAGTADADHLVAADSEHATAGSHLPSLTCEAQHPPENGGGDPYGSSVHRSSASTSSYDGSWLETTTDSETDTYYSVTDGESTSFSSAHGGDTDASTGTAGADRRAAAASEHAAAGSDLPSLTSMVEQSSEDNGGNPNGSSARGSFSSTSSHADSWLPATTDSDTDSCRSLEDDDHASFSPTPSGDTVAFTGTAGADRLGAADSEHASAGSNLASLSWEAEHPPEDGRGSPYGSSMRESRSLTSSHTGSWHAITTESEGGSKHLPRKQDRASFSSAADGDTDASTRTAGADRPVAADFEHAAAGTHLAFVIHSWRDQYSQPDGDASAYGSSVHGSPSPTSSQTGSWHATPTESEGGSTHFPRKQDHASFRSSARGVGDASTGTGGADGSIAADSEHAAAGTHLPFLIHSWRDQYLQPDNDGSPCGSSVHGSSSSTASQTSSWHATPPESEGVSRHIPRKQDHASFRSSARGVGDASTGTGGADGSVAAESEHAAAGSNLLSLTWEAEHPGEGGGFSPYGSSVHGSSSSTSFQASSWHATTKDFDRGSRKSWREHDHVPFRSPAGGVAGASPWTAGAERPVAAGFEHGAADNDLLGLVWDVERPPEDDGGYAYVTPVHESVPSTSSSVDGWRASAPYSVSGPHHFGPGHGHGSYPIASGDVADASSTWTAGPERPVAAESGNAAAGSHLASLAPSYGQQHSPQDAGGSPYGSSMHGVFPSTSSPADGWPATTIYSGSGHDQGSYPTAPGAVAGASTWAAGADHPAAAESGYGPDASHLAHIASPRVTQEVPTPDGDGWVSPAFRLDSDISSGQGVTVTGWNALFALPTAPADSSAGFFPQVGGFSSQSLPEGRVRLQSPSNVPGYYLSSLSNYGQYDQPQGGHGHPGSGVGLLSDGARAPSSTVTAAFRHPAAAVSGHAAHGFSVATGSNTQHSPVDFAASALQVGLQQHAPVAGGSGNNGSFWSASDFSAQQSIPETARGSGNGVRPVIPGGVGSAATAFQPTVSAEQMSSRFPVVTPLPTGGGTSAGRSSTIPSYAVRPTILNTSGLLQFPASSSVPFQNLAPYSRPGLLPYPPASLRLPAPRSAPASTSSPATTRRASNRSQTAVPAGKVGSCTSNGGHVSTSSVSSSSSGTTRSERKKKGNKKPPSPGATARRLDFFAGLPSFMGADAAAVPATPTRKTATAARAVSATSEVQLGYPVAAAAAPTDESRGRARQATVKAVETGSICRRLQDPDTNPHENPRGAGLHTKSISDVKNHPADIVGMLFIAVASAIAVAAGAGGGAIYVPVLILVMEFTPYEAVATSQALIFGGSLAGTILNFFRRNPRCPDRPVIDVEMVALMGPMQIAGATIGVVVSRCLPTYIVLGLLVLLLLFMSYKTLLQALRLKRESRKIAPETPGGVRGSLVMQQDTDREKRAVKAEKTKKRTACEMPKEEAQEEAKDGREVMKKEAAEAVVDLEEENEKERDAGKERRFKTQQQEGRLQQQQQQETDMGTESQMAEEDEEDEGMRETEPQQQQQQGVSIMLAGQHQLPSKNNEQQPRMQGWLWNCRLAGRETKPKKMQQREDDIEGKKMHWLKNQEQLHSLKDVAGKGRQQHQHQTARHVDVEQQQQQHLSLKKETKHSGQRPMPRRCGAAANTAATAGDMSFARTFSAGVAAAEEGRAVAVGGDKAVRDGMKAAYGKNCCGKDGSRDSSNRDRDSSRHSTSSCLCGVSAHAVEGGTEDAWQQEKRRHSCQLLAVFDSISTTAETEKEKNEQRLFTNDAIAAAARVPKPTGHTARAAAAAVTQANAAAVGDKTFADRPESTTIIPEPQLSVAVLTVSPAAEGTPDGEGERHVQEGYEAGAAAAAAQTMTALDTQKSDEQGDSDNKSMPVAFRCTGSSNIAAHQRNQNCLSAGDEQRKTS